jgi:hypothetical protein
MADLITRTAKRYYEEVYIQDVGRQFFSRVFGIADDSTSAAFMLDKFTSSPFALTYRQKDQQSRVVQYSPGSGVLIEPPIASRKTPLTEDLLDRVAAGIESTAGFGLNEAQLVNQILREHIAGLNMLKNKQAIDVLQDGVFYARGPANANVGLDINYQRAGANNLTYDFTVPGNTITEAFGDVLEQLRDQGTPVSNVVAILGANWQDEFNNDAGVQVRMLNNSSNILIASQMMPPELVGAEGLFVLGQYRGAGMLAPIWVCTYAPPVPYVSDEGQAPVPYVAANNAVFFSLDDIRYKINRGVNVLDEMGARVRAVGDLVIDRFSDNDPVTEYLRSSTRHCFVPANPNHTARSVGTF